MKTTRNRKIQSISLYKINNKKNFNSIKELLKDYKKSGIIGILIDDSEIEIYIKETREQIKSEFSYKII